jgi:hypothetical protein
MDNQYNFAKVDLQDQKNMASNAPQQSNLSMTLRKHQINKYHYKQDLHLANNNKVILSPSHFNITADQQQQIVDIQLLEARRRISLGEAAPTPVNSPAWFEHQPHTGNHHELTAPLRLNVHVNSFTQTPPSSRKPSLESPNDDFSTLDSLCQENVQRVRTLSEPLPMQCMSPNARALKFNDPSHEYLFHHQHIPFTAIPDVSPVVDQSSYYPTPTRPYSIICGSKKHQPTSPRLQPIPDGIGRSSFGDPAELCLPPPSPNVENFPRRSSQISPKRDIHNNNKDVKQDHEMEVDDAFNNQFQSSFNILVKESTKSENQDQIMCDD